MPLSQQDHKPQSHYHRSESHHPTRREALQAFAGLVGSVGLFYGMSSIVDGLRADIRDLTNSHRDRLRAALDPACVWERASGAPQGGESFTTLLPTGESLTISEYQNSRGRMVQVSITGGEEPFTFQRRPGCTRIPDKNLLESLLATGRRLCSSPRSVSLPNVAGFGDTTE